MTVLESTVAFAFNKRNRCINETQQLRRHVSKIVKPARFGPGQLLSAFWDQSSNRSGSAINIIASTNISNHHSRLTFLSPLQHTPSTTLAKHTSPAASHIMAFLPSALLTSLPKAAHLRDIQLPTNTHLRQRHRTGTRAASYRTTPIARASPFCAQKRGAKRRRPRSTLSSVALTRHRLQQRIIPVQVCAGAHSQIRDI